MAISMALNGDSPRTSDSDRDRFQRFHFDNSLNVIIANVPQEPYRLGRLDVGCLVINRMIGAPLFYYHYCTLSLSISLPESITNWLTSMVMFARHWHLFVCWVSRSGNEKHWGLPSILVLRSPILSCRSTSVHRIWPQHPKTSLPRSHTRNSPKWRRP